MKHHFKLNFGIEYKDKIYFDAYLKPLSIGAELDALDEAENLPELADDASGIQKARRAVHENLIYWSRQLSVDGIDKEVLTAGFLLDRLSGEDYAKIAAEQEALRQKYNAATARDADSVRKE